MDKLINKSLDQREILDDKIKLDLENFYNGLDFKQLMSDTEGYLTEFSMQFMDDVLAEYANRYIQLGLKFGKDANNQVIEYRSKRAVEKQAEGFGSD